MVSRFCTRCGQQLPANATSCPRCNAPVSAPPSTTTGTGTTSAAPLSSASPAEGLAPARRSCANCHAAMRWIGHYNLRATGAVAGASPAEGAETLLPFSLYYCQTCGKFDFYYPGT